MSDPVRIPGRRDVTGRLDTPGADHVVVACPPDPRQGGSRSDPRLRAVGDALAPAVACLRFDYGDCERPGSRPRTAARGDAERALSWARGRFDRVGLFGYSFGAGVALRAADAADACSVLAPPADAAGALDAVDSPLQVVVGERDTTVDWAPVADRAAALGQPVETLPATHRFRRDRDRLGRLVGDFLTERL